MSTRPVIYQIMTRLFGNRNENWKPHGSKEENGVGTFADISPLALAAIKDLGASHVWYTGVIRHATMATEPAQTVKGRAGSPYSITDYYDVNPDLATDPSRGLEEFDDLVARSHEAGLKVLIDFVPNHVHRCYKSTRKPAGVRDFGESDDTSLAFKASNNFYYLPGTTLELPRVATEVPADPDWTEQPAKASGNDVFSATPGRDDWYEAVKLNYGVDYMNGRSCHFDPIPNTWLKMRDILVYWARRGIDGFRCDMAEMVPKEFWGWVIPQVKSKHPDLIFVAEIYNPQAYRSYLNEGRFDYLYDKVGLYDSLRAVIQDPAASVETIAASFRSVEDIQDHVVNFLENHDEQRFCSRFFAGRPRLYYPALAVSAGLGRGAWLLYFGQEWSEKAEGHMGFSADDGRTSLFDYIGVPAHQKWMNNGAFDAARHDPATRKIRDWHARVLRDIQRIPALNLGSTTMVATGHPRVLAWIRQHQGSRLLFAANFDSTGHVFSFDGQSHALEAWDCLWCEEV